MQSNRIVFNIDKESFLRSEEVIPLLAPYIYTACPEINLCIEDELQGDKIIKINPISKVEVYSSEEPAKLVIELNPLLGLTLDNKTE